MLRTGGVKMLKFLHLFKNIHNPFLKSNWSRPSHKRPWNLTQILNFAIFFHHTTNVSDSVTKRVIWGVWRFNYRLGWFYEGIHLKLTVFVLSLCLVVRIPPYMSCRLRLSWRTSPAVWITSKFALSDNNILIIALVIQQTVRGMSTE